MSAAPTLTFRALGDLEPWRIARLEDKSREEGIARRLLGWHLEMVADGSIERTAVHEAGHALLLLSAATAFHEVVVHDTGAGLVRYHGARLDLAMPSLGSRIAVDLGGALAEHVVYGDADVFCAATDLERAAARLEDDESAIMIVPYVRTTIASHGAALRALADALVARRRLAYREVREVVRGAGMQPREPTRSPVAPADEQRRLQRVDAEIAERRARVERLKKVARPVTVEPFERFYDDDEESQ